MNRKLGYLVLQRSCNEKDLYSNLLKIAKFIENVKKTSCTLERKYYHYPDVRFVKKRNAFLNFSHDKVLENDWGIPISQINHELYESNFYKKYDQLVKNLNLKTHFSLYTFTSNFVHVCFYNKLDSKTIKKITNGFFKIVNRNCPDVVMKSFSTGFIVKDTYRLNDSFVISKPRIGDFNLEKIPNDNWFDYGDILHNSTSVVQHKFQQCDLGDNTMNISSRIEFILVLFKLVKYQPVFDYNLTFDFYGHEFGDLYHFHHPRNDYFHTELKVRDLPKFKKTYDYLMKNLNRYDFNVHNHTGRLGIALQTYHHALDQLGTITETTPYSVKIINSLLIPERDNSKNRFVNRVFLFLYYLGIRNKKTREILEIAYNWRSNYFHGAPTKDKKLKKTGSVLTEKYVELFLLNSARLIILSLLILKQKNGKDLTELIDNAYTVEGIRKLTSNLSKVKKYIPIYKQGIKIKEDGMNITILEC